MGRTVLETKGIEKWFPGTRALRGVDFNLEAGEIHLLLGENGAGKSTFLKILAGVFPPDRGEIQLEGRRVHLPSPQAAASLGIALVSQELSLVPHLSVAENILLGRWPRARWGGLDWAQAQALAQNLLKDLGLSGIDPRAEVASLNLAQRQLVEIARALARNPKVLLLDEPTSALGEEEQRVLFSVLQKLREQGVAIVYTTHKLREVFLVGDRVSIFRDGLRVATMPVREVRGEEILVELMIGRRLGSVQGALKDPSAPSAQALLEVEDLESPPEVKGCSFVLRKGEVLGVFGLAGSGHSELAQALFGLRPRTRGRIRLLGKEVNPRSPQEAIRLGLAYVPKNRQEAILPLLPAPANVTLVAVACRPVWGLVSPSWENRVALELLRSLGLSPLDPDRPARLFSGGNQQKIVLARWLLSEARVFLLDDPARGVDVGAREEMLRIFSRLAQEGRSLLFISSEPRELLAIAHRILVFQEGRIVAVLPGERATEEALFHAAMAGSSPPSMGKEVS